MPENENTPRSLPALAAAFAEMTAARTAPDAIRSMTFRTVKKGGFDPDDVKAYLDRLAGDVELLRNRVEQLEAQARAAEAATPAAPEARTPAAQDAPRVAEVDPFDEVGARVAELVRTFEEDVRAAERTAREEADAIVAKARGEADDIRLEARLAREEAVADAASIVASARTDGDRLAREAQARADELEGAAQRTLREAREQADEIMRAVTRSRDGALEEIRRMRDGLVDTLHRMDEVIAERPEEVRAADRLVVVEEPVGVAEPARADDGTS
jgi:DivIVA domain-containing protein